MSPYDLSAYKIREGERIKLEFEGGIRVEGLVITGKRNLQGTIILITFEDCIVSHFERILFTPEMGLYHMAVGTTITSAFSGPADYDSFDLITHQVSKAINQIVKTEKQIRLESLYRKIRIFRKNKSLDFEEINQIKQELKSNYPQDWLLLNEIKEIELLSLT